MIKETIKQDSELLNLPEEIIERILIYSTPDHDLNMIRYFNIRRTCKKFYRLMNSKYFLNNIIKKFSMDNIFNNKFET